MREMGVEEVMTSKRTASDGRMVLPIFSPYKLDEDEWEIIVVDLHFVEKG